jgi:DNA (cytosine-5)-methyltransferase 1
MEARSPLSTDHSLYLTRLKMLAISGVAGIESRRMSFSVLELCAGGGGQALGLEMAGFHHAGAVEYEAQFCTTLRLNRPHWDVRQQDIRDLRPTDFKGVDLLAAGVPCPPFSIAGKQLGKDDARDMFPAVMEIIRGAKPRGVLFENVPGLASAKFSDYRSSLLKDLSRLGYQPEWKVLNSSHFGVPQLRPRFVLIALQPRDAECFRWPTPRAKAVNVGETLIDLMAANGWDGAEAWAERATGVGPTLVGGSKKHGGPDLGPTRAKQQWRNLGVDGMGIADEAPDVTFPQEGMPRLTVRMAARIQSFPDSWAFSGRKTIAYRQVGNAFPPNVAKAVGSSILYAFNRQSRYTAAVEQFDSEPRLLEKQRSVSRLRKEKKRSRP